MLENAGSAQRSPSSPSGPSPLSLVGVGQEGGLPPCFSKLLFQVQPRPQSSRRADERLQGPRTGVLLGHYLLLAPSLQTHLLLPPRDGIGAGIGHTEASAAT